MRCCWRPSVPFVCTVSAFGVDVFMKRGFVFDTLFPSQEKYFVPEIEYVFGFVACRFGFFFQSACSIV